jgi:hypothetical protein
VLLALTAFGVGLALETGAAAATVADGDAVAANGDTEDAALAAGEGLPAGVGFCVGLFVGLTDGFGLAAKVAVGGCGPLAVAPFASDAPEGAGGGAAPVIDRGDDEANAFSFTECFLFSPAELFGKTRA